MIRGLFYSNRLYLGLICLLGVFLRMFHLSLQSIWLDEVATLLSAGQHTLKGVIETTFITERIPMLYPILMHYWTMFFGFSEFSIRLPSVIFGCLTIPIVYVWAKPIWGSRIALVSSLLIALSPFHIWHSQEARCITMMVFLNMLSVIFFFKIINSNKVSKLDYALYLVVTSLAMYTYYLSGFTIVSQNIIFFIRRSRKDKTKTRSWAITQMAIILLCVIPLLLLLTIQALTGERAHQEGMGRGDYLIESGSTTTTGEKDQAPIPSANSKAKAVLVLIAKRFHPDISGGLKFVTLEIPIGLTLGLKPVNREPYVWPKSFLFGFVYPATVFFVILCIWGIWRQRLKTAIPLLIFLLLPIIVVSAIKIINFRPVFNRHIILSLPFFCMFVAAGLCSIRSSRARRTAWVVSLFCTFLVLSNYYFNQKTYKDDWRYVSSYITESLAPRSSVIFHGEYGQTAFYYYTMTDPAKNRIMTTKLPTLFEVRERDGSLGRFISRDYEKVKAENKHIWVVTYYAIGAERDKLLTYLQKDYKRIENNCNIGMNFCLDRYQRLPAKAL